METLLNLIWPSRRQAQSTTLVRLGRVLHWIGLFSAAPFVIITLVIATQDRSGELGYLVLLAIAVPLYLGGRALRYVLANE